MCGIAGIVTKKSNNSFSQQVALYERATKLMTHRGPDNFGKVILDGIALFHHRLSIIDLDARSNQPFDSKSGTITTVYNGELYNFQDLKSQYSIDAITSSDTEILIESFQRKGEQIFKEWNGIFAAAFYDQSRRKLTLVRDRFGVKPLYYYENDDYFLFASEAKVLYAYMDSLSLSNQALAEYLWFGNPISGESMVEGVKKMAPGTYLEYDLDANEKSIRIYWDIPGTLPFTGKLDEAIGQTRTLLEEAVKRQLVSDVDVGVFLSGGIDSSAITAFASKHYSGKISTYSVEFDYPTKDSNELEKARYIAQKFGTVHHELKVEAKDISHVVEHLVYQHDEPFSDAANIPLYLLTAQLRGKISVVLQGDGGDEIFGGYRRYNLMDNYSYWKLAFQLGSFFPLPVNTKERVNRMRAAMEQDQSVVMFGLLNTLETPKRNPMLILNPDYQHSMNGLDPFKRYREVDVPWSEEGLVQRLLYSDTKILLPNTYLEKVDKSTMANSIEVRVPFLDHELTQFALSLPASYKVRRRQKKYLLRKALRGVVPDEILNGPKKGFGVPYEKWLATDLHDLAQDTFRYPVVRQVLNTNYLTDKLSKHKKYIGRDGFMLWKALILGLWLKNYENKISI